MRLILINESLCLFFRSFWERMNYVKDKEAREILAGEVQKIQRLWKEKDWKEIKNECKAKIY